MTTAHKIPAGDQVLLDALLFEPDTGEVKAAIMFNSGTGVPKRFYRRFAEHLAAHGYATVLYDYRGIGGSRPPSLRRFQANLRDWGERDMVAVLEWLARRYPDQPRFIVAHSIGGQLIGLMRNHELADAMFMIATSTGYWRWMTGLYRYFCGAIWFAYVPMTSRLFGYVPAKILNLGEDLPGGVAREWAAWCRRQNYMADFFGRTIMQPRYEDVRVPIHVLGFADDNIANAHTIPAMMAYYKNADVQISFLRPSDAGCRRIGHFGFFSARNSSLWRYPTDWLDLRLRALRAY